MASALFCQSRLSRTVVMFASKRDPVALNASFMLRARDCWVLTYLKLHRQPEACNEARKRAD